MRAEKMIETVTEKTLGEQRVRTSFNPSQEGIVDQIKQKSAELINLVNSTRLCSSEGFDPRMNEQARLIALAQTSYEEAAMWAVKAATA